MVGEIDTVQVTLSSPSGSYQDTVTQSGVVRYNADGSLDQSFGTDGDLIFSVGDPGAVANGVAVQPDGKIIIVGTSSDTQQVSGTVSTSDTPPYNYVSTSPYNVTLSYFTVARYNQDGSLDTSFAQNGASQLHLTGGEAGLSGENADGVTVQADGTIVVTGEVDPVIFAHPDIFWVGMPPYTDPPQPPGVGSYTVQYNPDGTLDGGFGVGGILFGPLAPPPQSVRYPQPAAFRQPQRSSSCAACFNPARR